MFQLDEYCLFRGKNRSPKAAVNQKIPCLRISSGDFRIAKMQTGLFLPSLIPIFATEKYSVSMRIATYLLTLCILCAADARAMTPETARRLQRGRELFEYGRWSDARNEFRQVRAELASTDYAAIQEVDYHLAACAVELGSIDAAEALSEFERNYPGSTTCDSPWGRTTAQRAT